MNFRDGSSGHRQQDGRANNHPPYGWRNGKYKHGMKDTPEWKAWVNARRRCTDPNHPDWKNYGGRGITMCASWRASFAAFYQHIGPRPAGLTLERIENDRGYQPGNVRWATRAQQTANRRPIKRHRHTMKGRR